ncbi:hypothetical protein LT42_06615 [Pseudomonas lutea]|uniref:Uncharacterized protein n=1 Tax=Pseudomonas lutea TaxID=243924 RepID=A0A9X0EGY1_9PSED|nr:hypothetical protein LT42_06615 [Pseudomonas lutea]
MTRRGNAVERPERETRLKEATKDLRLAIRCIRELSKTPGISKTVWDAAWQWQDESHKRWRHELDEVGRLSSITTATSDLVQARRVDEVLSQIPATSSGK